MKTHDDVSRNPTASSASSLFSASPPSVGPPAAFHPSFEPGAFDTIPNPSSSSFAPGPLTPMVEMQVETVYPATYSPFDPSLEMCFDDESLSNIEKIYLFSRSKTILHRSYMAQNLTSYLFDVSPAEAIEYVLPLVNELAIDEDDSVQEALASNLGSTLRWFFSNCQILDDTLPTNDRILSSEDSIESALLPMSTVVAILTTLLISSSQMVCQETRRAVVNLINVPCLIDQNCENSSHVSLDQQHVIRTMLFQQVVIGMSRWDMLTPQWSAFAPTNVAILSQTTTASPYSYVVEEQQPKSPQDGSSDSAPSLVGSGSTTSSSGASSITSIMTTSSEGQDYFETDIKPKTSAPTSQLRPEEPAVIVESQEESSDEAAMGRLSSMSLIASVTAGDEHNTLTPEIKQQFVSEVERVGKDNLHWIRVEASFAMGALAKVVPSEVVVATLIPLFEFFSTDTHPRVRHSSVFSLPNLLSRLQPKHRKVFATSTLQRLSRDPTQDVRAGVLEVLGETIYQFASDEDGPPDEIILLFCGPSRSGEGSDLHATDLLKNAMQHAKDHLVGAYSGSSSGASLRSSGSGQSLRSLFERKNNNLFFNKPPPEDDFFSDPSRSLICAYNYPAVILTTGRRKWKGRLREFYLELLRDTTYKVRHTLTASIGEVAKILGPEHAKHDALEFWQQRLKDEDAQLRLLAIDQLSQMLPLMDEGDLRLFLEQLPVIWKESLTGWRERLAVVRTFRLLFNITSPNSPVILTLFRGALRDPVAAIRVQAVEMLVYWMKLLQEGTVGREGDDQLVFNEIVLLATESTHRHRSTFVSCYSALVLEEVTSIRFDPLRWLQQLHVLSHDTVVGVRIGVSRLVGLMCDKLFPNAESRPSLVTTMINALHVDSEYLVRSYVAFLFAQEVSRSDSSPRIGKSPSFASFSQPPPISPTDEPDGFHESYDVSNLDQTSSSRISSRIDEHAEIQSQPEESQEVPNVNAQSSEPDHADSTPYPSGTTLDEGNETAATTLDSTQSSSVVDEHIIENPVKLDEVDAGMTLHPNQRVQQLDDSQSDLLSVHEAEPSSISLDVESAAVEEALPFADDDFWNADITRLEDKTDIEEPEESSLAADIQIAAAYLLLPASEHVVSAVSSPRVNGDSTFHSIPLMITDAYEQGHSVAGEATPQDHEDVLHNASRDSLEVERHVIADAQTLTD